MTDGCPHVGPPKHVLGSVHSDGVPQDGAKHELGSVHSDGAPQDGGKHVGGSSPHSDGVPQDGPKHVLAVHSDGVPQDAPKHVLAVHCEGVVQVVESPKQPESPLHAEGVVQGVDAPKQAESPWHADGVAQVSETPKHPELPAHAEGVPQPLAPKQSELSPQPDAFGQSSPLPTADGSAHPLGRRQAESIAQSNGCRSPSGTTAISRSLIRNALTGFAMAHLPRLPYSGPTSDVVRDPGRDDVDPKWCPGLLSIGGKRPPVLGPAAGPR